MTHFCFLYSFFLLSLILQVKMLISWTTTKMTQSLVYYFYYPLEIAERLQLKVLLRRLECYNNDSPSLQECRIKIHWFIHCFDMTHWIFFHSSPSSSSSRIKWLPECPLATTSHTRQKLKIREFLKIFTIASRNLIRISIASILTFRSTLCHLPEPLLFALELNLVLQSSFTFGNPKF